MAKAREEAVVQLTVQESGTDKATAQAVKYSKAMDDANKKTTIFGQVVGDSHEEVIGWIGAGRALERVIGQITGAYKTSIVATGSSTVATQTAARVLGGTLIPVIGQAILAYEAWIFMQRQLDEALKRNTELQKDNLRLARAGEVLYTAFLDKIEPLTGIWDNFTNSIKENILLQKEWAAFGRAALLIADWQALVYDNLFEATMQQVEGQNEMNKSVMDLENQLTDSNLTIEERTEKLRQLRDANIAILEVEKEVQEARVGVAQEQLFTARQQGEGIREAELNLAREQQKLGALELDILQEKATTQQRILDLEEEQTEEVKKRVFHTLPPPEMIRQQAFDFMKDFEEATLEYLESQGDDSDEIKNKIWDVFFGDDQWRRARMKIQLDDVFADEEEVADKMDPLLEEQARNRIAWAEFGAEGQLGVLGSLFSSASQMSAENFEVQKAFATGEALISGAAALVKVWRDPGFPVAIPLSAAIAANTISQISQIQQAQPGAGGQAPQGSILNPVYTRERSPLETASGRFQSNIGFQEPQANVVLVTEDLSAVQNRVAITEERAQI